MLATQEKLTDSEKERWHVLNAAKGSRLMMGTNGYTASGRNLSVDQEMVTDLLQRKMIERVGRGMYQLASAGKYFVFNHKEEMEQEKGSVCDDCHTETETTAVFRFNSRHHWVCDNCRQISDSSGR